MAREKESQIPRGTKNVCIFDTNAYRVLTFGKPLTEARTIARGLRHLEQSAGTIALANPFVIWELIGHLDDAGDPAYHHCLNALVALSEHTWRRQDPPGGVCLVSDAESTVCGTLFEALPLVAYKNVQNLALLAAHMKQNAPNVTSSAAVNNLKVFASEMKKKEERWLEDMQLVLNGCDPKLAQAWVGGTSDKEVRKRLTAYFGSKEFMNAWATVGVMSHADLVGAKPTPSEIEKKVDVMRNVFPVPFHVISALLQKFPTSPEMNLNSRKRKRENFMWDAAICYSIGGFHQIGGAAMFLVTDDAAIRDAAAAAKCTDRVVSLADYLKSLGFGGPNSGPSANG
jgi:hypothetical protein